MTDDELRKYHESQKPKDNGGPAFPEVKTRKHYVTDLEVYSVGGMTLRDYFAVKAMAAIVIGNNADICTMGAGCAADAYGLADAMLAERAK